MARDGATGILAVSEDSELTLAGPLGDDPNHFQGQLRASSILLIGGLPDLLLFESSAAARSEFRVLSLAIKPDEDGQGPDLLWGEGEGDMEGEDDPTMAESKERARL